MKKTTIVCDACGKQVEQGYFKEANLCQSCAHKLKDFLEKELGLKEVRK